MKICVLQCNVKSGKPEENALTLAEKAAQSGADLCIAPKSALTGVGGSCPFPHWEYEERCLHALDILAAISQNSPPLIFGLPGQARAFLAKNGLVVKVDQTFYLDNMLMAILPPAGRWEACSLPAGCELGICLDEQPFSPGWRERLLTDLSPISRKNGIITVFANLVGGYGQEIYPGQSFALNAAGECFARAAAFQEETFCFQTDADSSVPDAETDSLAASQWGALVLGTRDFFHKQGVKKALLGLSGGMDSAFAACVAAEALGAENVLGVLMPSQYSSHGSVRDALALAANLGISTSTISIESVCAELGHILEPALSRFPAPHPDLTLENIQPRVRGMILMALANRSGALVLNTGNKSEAAVGYCTLYGDTVGALAVIGDLFKTRIYELAAWYCKHKGQMLIPKEIFSKEPSAELRPDQKDTDSLPPYAELDPILRKLLDNLPPSPAERDLYWEIQHKVCANIFKRKQCPPPLLVDSCHL